MENVSQIHHSTSQGGHEGTTEGINHKPTNSMLIAMFNNLSVIANICLSIPVGTASVERSFSQMKMIKTRLRNHLGEMSLSLLMKMSFHKKCLLETWKRSLMSGTESHDGLLCKKSHLHSLRGGWGAKNSKRGRMPPTPHPPLKKILPMTIGSLVHRTYKMKPANSYKFKEKIYLK